MGFWNDIDEDDYEDPKLVGIWANGSSYYCTTYDDIEYSVVNGGWDFYIDHGVAKFGNRTYKTDEIFSTDWRIVLKDMPDMNYNQACELIRDAANRSHSNRADASMPVIQSEFPF